MNPLTRELERHLAADTDKNLVAARIIQDERELHDGLVADYLSFSIVLQGTARYLVRVPDGSVTAELRPGDRLIRLPGSVVSNRSDRGYLKVLGIAVSKNFIRMRLNEWQVDGNGGSPRFRTLAEELHRPEALPAIWALATACAVLLREGRKNGQDVARPALIRALLLQLVERCDGNGGREAGGSKARMTFESIAEFVQENCSQPLGRKEIGELFQIHPIHVSRLFRRFARQTYLEYLKEQRLGLARTLLTDASTMSIAEIAHEAGFATAAHFSRSFRERFGTSPIAFRAEQGKTRSRSKRVEGETPVRGFSRKS